jgi:DNA-binding transcriptional LysR family regulator
MGTFHQRRLSRYVRWMLEPLRHFALIVEHGTFREAARHAHLTQPALTASIQRLEAEVGTRLLERGRMGARPTPSGTALLVHARAALAEVEQGKRAALVAAGIEASEVRLAAGATVSTYVLPEVVARFRRAHPKAALHLRELPTSEATAAFEQRAVDLAIVSGKEGRPWLADELVLVCADKAAEKEWSAEAPLLVFPKGAGSRDLADRYFPEHRARSPHPAAAASPHPVGRAQAHDRGRARVPHGAARPALVLLPGNPSRLFRAQS